MTELTINDGTGIVVDLFQPPSIQDHWIDVASDTFYGTYSNGGASNDDWIVGETLSIDPQPVSTFEVIGFLNLGGTNYPVLFSGNLYYALAYDIPDLPSFIAAYDAQFGAGTGFSLSNVSTSNFQPCFYAGTQVATATGARAVEELQIGDLVRTADGRDVPVLWIGEAKVERLVNRAKNAPVRIKAGALGGGLPEQDLLVTADHGMMIEGMVINASALVNNDTILFEPLDALPDRFSYYHVELENHDVILANGAETESYLDAPTRSQFSNFQEYLSLYGAERIMQEMKAPRIASRRLLPETVSKRLALEPGIIVADRAFVA